MLTVLLSVIQGMIRKKSKMINLTKYARVIIPEEAGGFSCSIMEFPGCYSQGETPKEAWDNLNEAAENWIVACRSQGTPIPEPFPDGLALSIGQEYRKLTKGEDTTRITLPKKEGRPPYHCKPVEELITEGEVIKALVHDENSQKFRTEEEKKGYQPFGLEVKIDNSIPPGEIQARDPETGEILGKIINEEYAGEDYGRIIVGEPPGNLDIEKLMNLTEEAVINTKHIQRSVDKKIIEILEKGLTSKEEILARQAEIYKEIKKLTPEDRKEIFEFAKKRSKEMLEEGD